MVSYRADGYGYVMKIGLFEASQNGADIDYRFLRAKVLSAWRSGEVNVSELCDAQAELRRNAEFCGQPLNSACPVCEAAELVAVTYVFGPRLPSHGRCVTSARELRRLRSRKQTSQAYIVEVCKRCGWNHLLLRQLIGVSHIDNVENFGA